MSISSKKQNTNEKTFRPDYGTDANGIQYSCGHINPLQRALVNNGVKKLNSIKTNLETAIESINDFTKEILDFAKSRCEDIREVNSELRHALDNYECNCLDSYECENCKDLQNDKDDLQIDVFDLKDKIQEMEKIIEEKENLANTVTKALEKMEKKFAMVKDLVENLEEL